MLHVRFLQVRAIGTSSDGQGRFSGLFEQSQQRFDAGLRLASQAADMDRAGGHSLHRLENPLRIAPCGQGMAQEIENGTSRGYRA
jgi:hypothetical protein